jgi:hypothetical protein
MMERADQVLEESRDHANSAHDPCCEEREVSCAMQRRRWAR